VPDPIIVPLNPPQFAICEDVRSEVGGQQTLVGVYPGNVIVVKSFPHPVSFLFWAVTMVMRKGSLAGQFRWLARDGSTVFVSNANFNVSVANYILPMKFPAKFDVAQPGPLEAQIKLAEDDWRTIGRLLVSTVERLEKGEFLV